MRAFANQTKQVGGFSLIELLLVLTLMLVLSTMLYNFGSSRRQKSQKALCQDNLQKIYLSLQIYAKDFNDRLPFVTNAETAEQPLDVLVPRYSADNSLFICPGGRDSALAPGASLRVGKISYAYYMGRKLDDSATAQWPLLSDRQVNTNAKQKGEQLFSDTGKPPGNNHHKYGGNILLGDGTVVDSGPSAPCALDIPAGVTLLNPKP